VVKTYAVRRSIPGRMDWQEIFTEPCLFFTKQVIRFKVVDYNDLNLIYINTIPGEKDNNN
jgi:hypothetical protein